MKHDHRSGDDAQHPVRTARTTVVIELDSRRLTPATAPGSARLIRFPRQRQGNWPLETSALEGPQDPDGPDAA